MKLTKLLLILLLISGEAMAAVKCEAINLDGLRTIHRCDLGHEVCFIQQWQGSISCFPTNTKAK